jgi:hypothetical protein
MKNITVLTLFLTLTATLALHAQEKKADTVIVSLAKTSKIIFTIEDYNDLEILKDFNFDELFEDILERLKKNDSTQIDSTDNQTASTQEETEIENQEEENDDDDDDNNKSHHKKIIINRKNRIGKTWQSFNFDLGTNNYLSDNKFPDDNALYQVKPWGSWYVGAVSTQRTRLAKKIFLEWGLGVSWYNFKFQNANVMIGKNDDGLEFTEDPRDVEHNKSKLTVTYINASLIPVIDFGNVSHKSRSWNDHHSKFRIGAGPYIGYRIASKSKLVYTEEGSKEKEKERDSFHLNNLRYGARLQLGYRSTDLFFNYDMNELFVSGKGPNLNAFSFGVIF